MTVEQAVAEGVRLLNTPGAHYAVDAGDTALQGRPQHLCAVNDADAIGQHQVRAVDSLPFFLFAADSEDCYTLHHMTWTGKEAPMRIDVLGVGFDNMTVEQAVAEQGGVPAD